MDLHGRHLIAGDHSREGDERFAARNPATGEELAPELANATAEEIDRAAREAAAAAGVLASGPREQRARLLEAVAHNIEALGDELVERVHAETALPRARVQGERGRTVGQLRQFAGVVREGSWLDLRIDTALPDRAPIPRPDVRRINRALGPVAVFGASNFPLAFSVAGGDTASALAAGCPVVVKAHPAHPGTSELVGEAITSAVARLGLPSGTFSLIQGQSNAVGEQLVRHPAIRAVGFTGSLRGGRALFNLAAARPEPIPVFAEMGSVNPVFVLPGALAHRSGAIAEGLVASMTNGVGQFCTNPGIAVVQDEPSTDVFLRDLARRVEESDPGIMLHEGIAAAYRSGVDRLARHDAVTALVPPRDLDGTGAAVRAALFETSAGAFVADPDLQEEVFGPVTLVVRCADSTELTEVASALAGQLTGTVHHGDDAELAAHGALLETLVERVGRLIFGGYPTGVEVCQAMVHGGPYPATSAPATTSVGMAAIDRFLRPVAYQNAPVAALPPELRDENPEGLLRMVDGEWTRDPIGVGR